MTRIHRQHQTGAALLAAMLTVTLVATLAAAALWQQWRNVEVEAAERARTQSAWILVGALDWARLILREDARSGGADHLAEPWAVPLQEARLASFLSVDKNASDTEREAFLSGGITDLQARLNVTSLIDGDKIAEPVRASFARLFELLGLPPSELTLLVNQLRLARTRGAGDTSASAPLPPQQANQLGWLGLSPQTLKVLDPYITLLPVATPVNLNTASAEVLYASIPGLDMAGAQQLIRMRERSHFRTLTEAGQQLRHRSEPLDPSQHAVATRFFEVRGRLRLEQMLLEERSVVQRDGLDVRPLWRDRVAMTEAAAPPATP